MYVACRNCHWAQDDFWDESYNPAKSMLDWADTLIMPHRLRNIPGPDETGERVNWQELIARDFEAKAQTMRKMVYLTLDEVKAANWVCPQCQQPQLTLD